MSKTDELKTWWTDNSWMMEDHWDAYLELGGLIKSLADEEKTYFDNAPEPDYEPAPFRKPYQYSAPHRPLPIPKQGPTDPTVPLPNPPFLGPEQPVPPRTMHLKKLDPLPYVQFEGIPHFEERYSMNDPMRVHGRFAPRPEFEQSRDRYGSTRMGPGL